MRLVVVSIADSNFDFWNFLDSFPQIFLILPWLNLQIENPRIWREGYFLSSVKLSDLKGW